MVAFCKRINAEFAKNNIRARLTINDGMYVLRAHGNHGYYLEDVYKPQDKTALRFLENVLAKCESEEEFFAAALA